MIKKGNSALIIFIAIIIAFMYVSGIPSIFFINIKFVDVDPICITLIINIVFTMIVGLLLHKVFIPNIELGYKKDNLVKGIKKYGVSCFFAFLLPMIAFSIGLMPFNYKLSVYKVLIEGIIYYVGVGIIEEFFNRGLLLNAISEIFKSNRNNKVIAVILSSIIFGIGHVFGMIGYPIILILCKVVWATGLGIYLGAIYVKTKNLWLVSIFHTIIDLCGLPFCFTTTNIFPDISSYLVLVIFIIFGIYGIYILKDNNL